MDNETPASSRLEPHEQARRLAEMIEKAESLFHSMGALGHNPNETRTAFMTEMAPTLRDSILSGHVEIKVRQGT